MVEVGVVVVAVVEEVIVLVVVVVVVAVVLVVAAGAGVSVAAALAVAAAAASAMKVILCCCLLQSAGHCCRSLQANAQAPSHLTADQKPSLRSFGPKILGLTGSAPSCICLRNRTLVEVAWLLESRCVLKLSTLSVFTLLGSITAEARQPTRASLLGSARDKQIITETTKCAPTMHCTASWSSHCGYTATVQGN